MRECLCAVRATNDMKVLLTGISGFLGHHITKELLKSGHEVVGVDKRPIAPNHAMPSYFIQTDVRDLGYRDLLGMDYVIHLSWRTNIPDCQRHPKDSTAQNIGQTVSLLEVAREVGVKKFLFPSTASLYGHNPTPWKEDMPPEPIEPYSWQKLACEQLCRMYSHTYGLPTAIFRFFQVFGELQREDTALAAFMRFKKEGKPITLTETTAQSSFRSGQRDFIYAGDLARAVVMVMEADTPNGEIYNVSTGETHTMQEIADAIGGLVKWIPRREYEVERHEGDICKLQTLGWKPSVDVIKWIKKQPI